jgi:hypothetical protein
VTLSKSFPQSPAANRRDWLLLTAASLLATAPVWLATFPPMTDLPQHASQIVLLGELLHGGFRYEALFHINWFTPYLLGYLLVYALVPWLGVIGACKAVICLALVALPLATALVMVETGADRRWALLVIPAMYGFSFQWGFLNFVVAAPLGLVFVWLVLRHARRPTLGGAIALGVLINALFFCHAMICAFFGVVAGCILLLSAGRSVSTAIRRVLPLVSVLPVMLVWGSRTLANPAAQRPVLWDLNWLTTLDGYYSALAAWTTPGGWGWGRTAGFFPRLLGVRPGVLVTLFGLALFLVPLAAGARFTRRPAVWVPFTLCVATLLFAPGILFGTDFTFQRFTVFALPLYLVLLERRLEGGWPKWTWPVCGLLAAAWIGVVSANTLAYERDAAGFDEVLARMEPGERALSFAYEHDSAGTIAPPFLHFPSWYSALKGGVVDPNIAGTHVQLVLYRPEQMPPARLWGFEWNPFIFDWRFHGGTQYRYFVARAPQDLSAIMFRGATCSTHLVHHANHWWLYEKDPGCVPRAPFRF